MCPQLNPFYTTENVCHGSGFGFAPELRTPEKTTIYAQVSNKTLQNVHNPFDAILRDNTLINKNIKPH